MDMAYDITLWVYYPNQGAAIFFMAAFLATGLYHLWQCHRYKSYKLTWLLPVSGLWFVIGYGLRTAGAFGFHGSLAVYISSLCLIAVVPPLLSLFNYHIFGHLLYYVPYLAPMPPNKVLLTFGVLSLLIETLNGLGAALGSNPNGNNAVLGEHFMRASLALQIILNVSFLLLMGWFHRRCSKAGLARARGIAWPLATLYASVLLILTRTVYRTVEHFGMEELDRRNTRAAPAVVRAEWYFLVFESTLMLVDMVMWNVLHPRKYLPSEVNVYLARDGVTEVQGPVIRDQRPRAYRWLDPFDVMRRGDGESQKRAWRSVEEQPEHAL